MQLGFLTAPFHNRDLADVVRFAARTGFQCLEVVAHPGSRHIDTAKMDDSLAREVRKLFDNAGLKISSLACYTNPLEPDASRREEVLSGLRKSIDAAQLLGIDVVCTLAGMPLPGKSRMETIEQEAAGAFGPLCDYAAGKGVKIALENWFATNIQHLGHFERIFEVVPHPNFGLNYDPSHLVHQQIDYMAAVDKFFSRIFHTHAKDTEINHHRLRWVGSNGGGWWRYVIPGFGEIHWGRYLGALRRNGFDGAVSIEHEDGTFSEELGMVKGYENLKPYIA